MRQRHLNERGSSQWPFVITLVILLVFVYMWFSEKDKRDVAETDRAKSQEEYANLSKATTDVLNYFRDVSAKVGWASKSLNDVVQDPNAKEVLNRLAGSGGAFVTDVAQVDKQITRDGTTEGGKPGLYNYLINDSDISIRADLRTRGAEGVKETNVSFEWMTPEFRQKLKEIAQIPVPVPPKPPADADDEAAQAKYQSEQKTYEADVKKINDGMAELQTMGEQWKKYEEIIKGPRPFDPDTQRVVKLLMFTPEASGTMDLATLVTLPPKVVDNYKSEFRANKEEDTAVIDRVQADNQSKETTITNGQNELKAEQQRHVQEVDQLRGELTQANQTADTNRQEATKALNDLQHEKELHSNEVAQLNSQKNALENRVRLNKEVTDLEIRRNDPDGRVLASSPTMGTAIIDLGTQARVTPGTRFEVSRIGKGGIRSVKGQIQVIQVLGPTSSKVSILSLANPQNPIGEGDLIANPFFSATKPIHVYFAGELENLPREVAVSRLATMNAVVDKEVDGDTDYIVVPSSMTAPQPKAADGGDEEAQPQVGAKSPIEKVESLAREFGAKVITERLLDEYLGL